MMKLLHANDIVKNSSTARKMQEAMDPVSHACHNYDLKIITKVYQPAPGKPFIEPTDCKLSIDSPILEALCLEQCTLIMLVPELLNTVWHLPDYVEMLGRQVESGLSQS